MQIVEEDGDHAKLYVVVNMHALYAHVYTILVLYSSHIYIFNKWLIVWYALLSY